MKVKINENTLNKIVKESVKNILKEIFYFNTDDAQNTNVQTPKQREPRTLNRVQAIGDFMWLANSCHMKFKELPQEENTIVMYCPTANGQPTGDVEEMSNYLHRYINDGELEEVGSGINKNGLWYKKYKILVNLV